MIVELRVEGHSSTESENMEACEEMEKRLKQNGFVKNVKPAKVADIIREIINAKTAFYRYYGSRACSAAIQEKLIDDRGLKTQTEVTKFFLNTDLEDIRPIPKSSRRFSAELLS